MVMQQAGAPITALESMFSTSQKLKNIVRTSHGNSKQSFGAEGWMALGELQGVGQGNGKRPAVWAVLSTVILFVKRQGVWVEDESTSVTIGFVYGWMWFRGRH